ncbi:hypothetical protein DEU56DRAFT_925145 [Suillus clintonianus]|uniref:uncharacterized protein n=1 Tax=Suillus clintonianus TaxID=1904413 RepID=UPI001B869008|nr:uncharacterized protein DEU56DRAFT_925145 [Suillus clintonianus]KAG2123241.1 hypothetical protein DEU56DRAFT_925145 [Suillus clintonianus]
MTTFKSQTYDSVPVTDSLPQYDTICTSALSADFIQCKRSIFSCLSTKQIETRRATVLSLIREIVSSPGFNTYSVPPIVNSCADALPAAEFSDLLQQPNIEDHTALYWAIINNRRDVLWAFDKFISQYSPVAFADLRIACMAVSDHDLFMQMDLGDDVNPKDKSLRRMLGCPRDEINVFHHGLSELDSPPDYLKGDELDENHFIASFSFKMFQKRLRITRNLAVEFVARGRIWVLRFYMGSEGKWCIEYGLSENSSPPVRSHAKFAILAHSNLPELTRALYLEPLIINTRPSQTLVPRK